MLDPILKITDIIKETKTKHISGEQLVAVPASKPISVRPREEEEEDQTPTKPEEGGCC